MLDVVTAMRDLLYGEWIETDPEVADLKFCLQDYGKDMPTLFDPNACYPQIAIQEIAIESVEVRGELWRKTHTLSLIVYLRPINYQPATIATFQETFRNMIAQIDEILKAEKYTTTGINDIKLSTWRDQTRKQDEPIVFIAAQEIKVVYYE